MRRSIKYLAYFVVIFFIMDVSFGFIMDRVFPGITYGTYGKVNKSLQAREDILIFGSSRAEHHYDPELLSRQTAMSCYNTGLGGYGLFYNYALVDEVVKSHTPKVIILDLSPNVIVDPKSYMKLNIFTPYYFDYPSFEKILKLDPEFSKFKTFFKTYVYNSTLYDLVRSKISDKKPGNGYKGLNGKVNVESYAQMKLSDSEVFDSTKRAYLEKFIDIALKNNVRLVCIVSPTYEKFDVNNRIIDEMEELIVSKGAEFYDYSDYKEVYQNPNYFKDQLHINANGVKIFDKEVSQILMN